MRLPMAMPRLERLYRRPANTYDLLKSLAVLSMVVDHVGVYLLPELLWLRVVGRLAFPLFLFLVGYSRHTRVDLPLLLGALVVTGLEWGYRGALFPLNILWGVALTRWYLGRVSPERANAHRLPLLLGGWLVVPLLSYGALSLAFGILGAMARTQGRTLSRKLVLWGMVVSGVHTVIQLVSFDFDILQSVVTAAIGAGLAGCFMRFTLRPVKLPLPALLLSRYALEVYIIHIALLMALSAVVG